MKKLAVVTGSRAEYGQLRPFLRLARESKAFELQLVVAGMHLLRKHGYTVQEVQAEFPIAWKWREDEPGDSLADAALTLSSGIAESIMAYQQLRPDLVLVEGDRVEALAAALAAGYMDISIAHGGGGDVTRTIDNAARNAISHFASLHFVTHEGAAERLRAMGVCGDIHVTGGLGIDAIRLMEWRSREETLADLGLPAGSRYLLVAFHPESERPEMAGEWMMNLLRACVATELHVVITYPNSDPGSAAIIQAIVDAPNRRQLAPYASLGSDRYLHALKYADALVGNSSSGLYEAPTLRVPVVNVGHRQDGRLKAANVLNAGYDYDSIGVALTVIQHAKEHPSESLCASALECAVSPYGDGHAAERMMKVIEGRLGK